MSVDPCLPIDLGDDLVLRQATPSDTEALVAFNAEIHRGDAPEPSAWIAAWTRDLMQRPHPTFQPGDFTIVEDTLTGAIVSSLNLISQTWSYDGVPFGVGRIELVGTHPAYRRRGLVRRQFEVVHRWSAERGQLVQAITGIPWYYRQFGYEYALELDGGPTVGRLQIPRLREGEAEPFHVRAATDDDVAFLAELDARARCRYLVACVRDAALWRYEVSGRSERAERGNVAVIEDAAARRVGYLVHDSRLNRGMLGVSACELAPGVSWLAATPSLLRHLAVRGEEYTARQSTERFAEIGFLLGADHPICPWLPDRQPRSVLPYAWYLRVPDLPAFIHSVGATIEARLAASDAVGHTSELRLSFYRDGLRLAFVDGRLRMVEAWSPASGQRASAAFPDLTFLQLLFGYRSFDELAHAFPDCRAREHATRSLLDILFPKRPSPVWPVA